MTSARKPTNKRPRLVWHGSASTIDGLSDEIRSFLFALESGGYEPGLHEWVWAQDLVRFTEDQQRVLGRMRQRDLHYEHNRTPRLFVEHYPPWKQLRAHDEDSITVSRAMYETDRIPSLWAEQTLRRAAEIWVPSPFNVETFERSGVPLGRLRTLGQTIDFTMYDPECTSSLPLPSACEGRQVFLMTCDFSQRKGWEQLLEAWAQAFAHDDPAALLIKTHPKTSSGQDSPGRVVDRWFRARLGEQWEQQVAPVVLMSEFLSIEQMPQLYKAVDAFVMPSRGEGWGRPYMEALAMGLPVIASGWGAHACFLSAQESWMVGGRLIEVGEHAREVFGRDLPGHRWFEVDVEALAEALRRVAADPVAARHRAQPGRARLMHEYSAELLAERAQNLADDLWDRRRISCVQPLPLSARKHRVALVCEWHDKTSWQSLLLDWCQKVAPSDPITLVLWCGAEEDSALVLDQVESWRVNQGIEDLPDMTLVIDEGRGELTLAELLAGCQAALSEALPAELIPSAPRIMASADELLSWLKSVDEFSTVPQPTLSTHRG